MLFLYTTLVAGIGAIIGSFLNVCIYRYGTGLSIGRGRSQCPHCGKKLEGHELVPIVSFLFQKGRCSLCRSGISWQYPLVELSTAILFVLVFLRQYALYPIYVIQPHGLAYLAGLLVFYWVIIGLLVIIAVYDIRHKIIPDGIVYTFIGLSVIKLLVFLFLVRGSLSTMDMISPLVLFLPFWLLWYFSKGTWIGLGDGKLAAGIGALLGFSLGLSALVLGFWIGAACCLIVMFIERFAPGIWGLPVLSGRTEIPLGPFLIIGTLIVLFCHVDVLGLSALL